MPYIVDSMRIKLEPTLGALVAQLKDFDDEDIEGVMNYTITEILNRRMKPETGWRYKWINRAIGVLEAVKFEFYRRLVANYEQNAINLNGDIGVYSNFP
jgi:hypothetical protein